MNSFLKYFTAIVFILVVQIIIPPYFVKPNLLLTIVVVAALLRGPRFALGIGFFTGTLQGLFQGDFFGVQMVAKIVIGGIVGLLEGNFFKEKYLIVPFIAFFATIGHELLTILISEKLLFKINIIRAFQDYILVEGLLNALFALILYFIFFQVDKPEERYYG